MVMGTISAELDGEQLYITVDDSSVFLVDPEHDVREEPWGLLLDINLLWTCLSTDMHGM